MRLFSQRWRHQLRWGKVIILLTVLAAVVGLGAVSFFRAFYGYDPRDYRPFDLQREQQVHTDSSKR